MRVIIPPMGNETISMLKNTSLLSVIAVLELYTVATQISSQNLRQVELLIVVSCWYLFLTSVLSIPQYYLERHYGRGQRAQPAAHPDPTGQAALDAAARRHRSRPHQSRAVAKGPTHDRDTAVHSGLRHPGPARTVPLLSPAMCARASAECEVLKGITLSVNAGEVMCLLGPSGSGKSTFLRCINHLERIDGGRISVDGELIGYAQRQNRIYEMNPREVARQRRGIGMVFQRFNLFPHMTALENVTVAPIGVKKLPKQQARQRGLDLLDRVGLADLAQSYPAQLSGGQQQRVAIARPSRWIPKLLLFDEPTQRARPRTCRRCARRDAHARRRRNDHDRGHPRDRFRPRRR